MPELTLVLDEKLKLTLLQDNAIMAILEPKLRELHEIVPKAIEIDPVIPPEIK